MALRELISQKFGSERVNLTCNLNCSMTTEKHERFEKAFSAPSVQHIYIGDISFVLLNSMALEGDGCRLCREAEKQLEKIYQQLKCSQVHFIYIESIKKLNLDREDHKCRRFANKTGVSKGSLFLSSVRLSCFVFAGFTCVKSLNT